jgi:rare lipoprotein A
MFLFSQKHIDRNFTDESLDESCPVGRLVSFVLIIVSVVSIVSCASTGDSAPANYTKQWHEIPDAVPEKVSRSKYGNPDSYEVMGETYYVKDVASDFEQHGIASWYGTKFHGRRTSSGEEYDMYAMTAAHKTMPIPAYVEVTNIDNGRKAIVRVNDRGPFHEGRIIDLSYAAATKLGVAQTGTAKVKIRLVGPGGDVADDAEIYADKPAAEQPVKTVISGDNNLYVQVAAFSTEANALKHIEKLQGQGFFDVRLHVEKRKAATLYRVRIGPLPSENVAKNILASLEDKNHQDLKIIKIN